MKLFNLAPPRTHAHKGRVGFVRFCLFRVTHLSHFAPSAHPSGRVALTHQDVNTPFLSISCRKSRKWFPGGEYPFCQNPAENAANDFPFLPEMWRKYRKNYPAVIKCYLFDYPPPFCKSLFFSKARQCKSMLFAYSPWLVNIGCFPIRPGVSLHPSLAAPFLFSPGVSILSISQQSMFCPKPSKKPGHHNCIILHAVKWCCPNVSERFGRCNYMQIKYLMHVVRKSTVFRTNTFHRV